MASLLHLGNKNIVQILDDRSALSRKIFLPVVLIPDEDFGHKLESPAPVNNPPHDAPPHIPANPKPREEL
jgi:hypothetical protein